jgi:hypothetical protein
MLSCRTAACKQSGGRGFRMAIKGPSGVETGCHMDWADYLRDEAAKYRRLAEAAEDLS